MLNNLRPAAVMIALMTLVTGVAYPLAVTGLAQLLFPASAGGSLIERDGRVIGSALIGQNFSSPHYFHSRPSATQQDAYNAAASGGSNAAPTSKALLERVAAGVAEYSRINNIEAGTTPADAALTSGSGLDPHISPENAALQVNRVATARRFDQVRVRELVHAATEDRTLGFIGEPRVNVLVLNLSLDRETASPPRATTAPQ
jgi:K+-transporting ATPase ATPase C chain